MISFFSVFPCCIAVNPVFQKFRCAVLDGDSVLQMFSLFLDHTFVCVLVFLNHGSSKIRIGSQFFWFPVVFPPFIFFWGVSPLPAFLSQILIPAACWQGSRQCDLRCVL